MDSLLIQYEIPPVHARYFRESVLKVIRSFKECKVEFLETDDVYKKSLHLSRSKRTVLFTNKKFNHPYYSNLIIEGIGCKENGIGVVSYQSSPLSRSLFLFSHELGHVFGLSHCANADCIMGFIQGQYAWHRLYQNKKIDRRLFCRDCRASLRQGIPALIPTLA